MAHLNLFPLVLGTGLFLGIGNPLAKLASADGIHAMAFTLWPTALAGALLALFAAIFRGAARVNPHLLAFGLIAGAFGHAIPMVLAYWLAAHAGAGFASLSFTLTPVLTLAIMAAIGREPLKPIRMAAVATGMVGGLLLVGGQVMSSDMDLSFMLVAMMVPSLIAATNVYRGLHMPRKTPDEWLSAVTLIGSSVVLLGLWPFVETASSGNGESSAFVWLAMQVVALVAGYLCYFALQRRAEPVAFSLIGYVMMLTSVAVGVLFFNESIHWTLWPAILMIGAALWLIHRNPVKAGPIE